MATLNRFWNKTRPAGECLEWTAGKDANGYGRIGLRKHNTMLAHRCAWEIATTEPIPEGLCVCHHCDNPKCVRLEHLFLGTKADNTADMMRKGRQVAHRREECRNGHPMHVYPSGRRGCLVCRAANFRRSYADPARREEKNRRRRKGAPRPRRNASHLQAAQIGRV